MRKEREWDGQQRGGLFLEDVGSEKELEGCMARVKKKPCRGERNLFGHACDVKCQFFSEHTKDSTRCWSCNFQELPTTALRSRKKGGHSRCAQ